MEKLIAKITDKDFGLEYNDIKKPNIRISARGVVIRDDGKIALFNKINKNEYKLPGGGIENKETPRECFLREILEETGCKVKIEKELGVTEEYKYKNNFKQISYVYVSKIIEDTKKLNLTQKETDEGSTVLWVTPNEALNLITSCDSKLKPSKYDDIYITRYVILRDKKILEYYINMYK